MKKLLLAILLVASAAVCAFGQSNPPLTVTEVDGSPRGTNITKIVVSNGTLTISGHTATISTGGGGGGGCTPPGTLGRILYDDGAGGCLSITGATTNGTFVTLTNALATTAFSPSSNDGAALGSGTASFSDLFLASGAVINYANGNVVLTHSSGILTLGTGELRITTVGTNAASVPTLGSTSTLTNKTLTTPTIADFTNATHNHQNNAGGGTLTTSALSGLGTGVATALAVNVGSAGAFITFNGAGGTPSSLTLTNATGLPPTTGISGWPVNSSGVLTNDGAGNLSWGAGGGGITGSGTTGKHAKFTGTTAVGDSLISETGTTITSAGDVVPDTDNTRKLGTSALRWSEVNVGPGSIHIRNDNTNSAHLDLGFSSTTAKISTTSANPIFLSVGGTDGLTLSTSNILGATGAGGIDPAALVTSAGVIPDGALSTNVPLLNGANTFAAVQNFSIDDATNNNITTLLDLRHSTSGTPAISLGASIRFGLESSTTVNRDAARINTQWTTVTDGSRTASMTFQLVNSAAALATKATLDGNGSFTITGTYTGNGSGLTNLNAGNISTGTVPAANGGAGSVNGIMQANGSGVVSVVTVGSSLSFSGGTLGVGATVVQTGQSNTYSTGAQDFTSATSFTVPTGAVLSPTANGQIAYRTGTSELVYGDSGTNRIVVNTDEAQSLANKTLTSSSNVIGGVTMTLGSDANGDVYYRASNVLTRLGIGSTSAELLVSSSAPVWKRKTHNILAYGAACDGTTNDRTAVQNMFDAMATGDKATFEGCKSIKINSQTNIGNGSGTYGGTSSATASTVNDIEVDGAGVTVIWGGSSGAVFNAAGPLSRLHFHNFSVNMASNAGIAFDLNHTRLSTFENLYVLANADYGLRLRAYQVWTPGDGANGNTFDAIWINSTTSGAKGFDIGYTDTCSSCSTHFDPAQNHFRNIRARFDTGVGTYVASSIGLRLNFTDASQCDDCIFAAATAVSVNVPSGTSGASYPAGWQFNTLSAQGSTASFAVTGTWTAVEKFGFVNYLTGDSQTVPTDSNTYGITSAGTTWGFTQNAGYITGLQLTWNSTSQIQIGTGVAQIQGTGRLLNVSSALTINPSLSTNTWYYCYVYDNSGTPAGECVTTAPAAAWFGTARSKTSDTSRRYVGAIRTNGSSQLYTFYHNPQSGYVQWLEDTTASPFRVASGLTATTETSVDCTAVAPATARQIQLRTINTSTPTGNVLIRASSGGNNALTVRVNADLITPATVTSGQLFYYLYNVAPSGAFYGDVVGYFDNR